MQFSQFADYHTHTPLCRHAEGNPVDYAKRAIEIGLDEIGFSDHSPMNKDGFDEWRMLKSEFPIYLQSIQDAKKELPNIPIKLGLEVDYFEDGHEWIEELSQMADYDYLIGSVHYIAPGFDIDNPKWIGRWSGVAEIDDIWEAYWRIYTSCIKSGFFDILAHPDLPKKFGHRPSGSLKRFYSPAIEAAKEVDVCIEINTAGWRKDCNEQYPEKEFLEMMLEAEIPLSINSDAHSPIDVGMDFEKAAKLAYEIGYNKTVRFNKRQRTEIPFSI